MSDNASAKAQKLLQHLALIVQVTTLVRNPGMTLTPTGAGGLDALAASLGLNRSELVEQIGR